MTGVQRFLFNVRPLLLKISTSKSRFNNLTFLDFSFFHGPKLG
jgi:hypothetical protein